MKYTTFDQVFGQHRYPAGETHLAVRPQLRASDFGSEGLVIEFRITGFEGLCQMVTADRLLARNGVAATWFTPYFPFARHDRRNHRFDGFELGVALDLVANLNLVIADPHSDVAGQLSHIPQSSCVDLYRKHGTLTEDTVVVIPDAGATKKTLEWAKGAQTVQALKSRDAETGKLSGFQVLAEDLGCKPCVVVDDICDGGGTFLGLASQLKEKNAGALTLAVTHGLFTNGIESLSQAFDRIVTFRYLETPSNELNQSVDYLSFRQLYLTGARR